MEIAKTLDQGLLLLDSVASDGPATVAELAQRTGLNRTVAHRLAGTLERRGFLRRDVRGTLTLGSMLLELGDLVDTDLRAAARIPLETLAAQLRETAVLSVADGDEAVAIDQAGGHDHLVRVDYRPGFRHPLTRAAHGKALLAFTDEGGAAAEFAEVRHRGFAVSHDELQHGAAGIAAPVRDHTGQVIASIGIVAPLDRIPPVEETAPPVLAAAAQVSRHLGLRGEE